MNIANPSTPVRKLALAAIAAVTLAGCAGPNPRDPYEGYNRAVFNFNDKVDEVALKPVATVYKSVLPGFMQTGVNNFFGNLADVWTAANNFMQAKGEQGMTDVMRVAVNSTFGLLGVLDVASEAGLQKHKEDFGQTLGFWGVSSGPYLVLPLLGPSTVRDTLALPLDIKADPWQYNDRVNVRNVGTVVRVIDQRAALLDASNLLEDAALDRYEFIRDGYMQQRESKVFDGEANPRAKKKSAYMDDDKPATADAEKGKDQPQAIMSEPAADSQPVTMK